MKKLYRSENKVFAGILGGLGEYLDIDPTILRLAYILVAILTGLAPAIIGYVIAYLIVPKKPENQAKEAVYTEKPKETPKTEPVKEKKPEENNDEPRTEEMI